MSTDRRQFCKLTLVGGASVSVLGCATMPKAVAKVSDTNIELLRTENPALAKVGGQVSVTAGDQRLVVVRTGEDVFIAVDQRCTHKGCSVAWNPDEEQFKCPCHGSTFASDGTVTHGPARDALGRYGVRVDGDKLSIAFA